MEDNPHFGEQGLIVALCNTILCRSFLNGSLMHYPFVLKVGLRGSGHELSPLVRSEDLQGGGGQPLSVCKPLLNSGRGLTLHLKRVRLEVTRVLVNKHTRASERKRVPV